MEKERRRRRKEGLSQEVEQPIGEGLWGEVRVERKEMTVGTEEEKVEGEMKKKGAKGKYRVERPEKEEIPIGWGWLKMTDPWSKESVWMKLPLEEIERRQAYNKRESAPDYKGRIAVNVSQEYKRDYRVELEDEEYFEWSVVVQPKHLPGGRRMERVETTAHPQNPLKS